MQTHNGTVIFAFAKRHLRRHTEDIERNRSLHAGKILVSFTITKLVDTPSLACRLDVGYLRPIAASRPTDPIVGIVGFVSNDSIRPSLILTTISHFAASSS